MLQEELQQPQPQAPELKQPEESEEPEETQQPEPEPCTKRSRTEEPEPQQPEEPRLELDGFLDFGEGPRPQQPQPEEQQGPQPKPRQQFANPCTLEDMQEEGNVLANPFTLAHSQGARRIIIQGNESIPAALGLVDETTFDWDDEFY